MESFEGIAPDTGSNWLRPRGSNQLGMGQFNERVVLQAIRFHGSMPKADLARLTNLSTQTGSLIINRLLEEQLVIKLPPLRGKVGQPSVPIALNPQGAFSIGIKIGRRSMDVLLMDFVGQPMERASVSYPFPDPDTLFAEIERQLQSMYARLGPARLDRHCRSLASGRLAKTVGHCSCAGRQVESPGHSSSGAKHDGFAG